MTNDVLAARIVDAIRNLPPWERGRWSFMVRTVKAALDHAVAEHGALEPADRAVPAAGETTR